MSCTFPHNDSPSLVPDRIRSLAYLGAAVALIRRGDFKDDSVYLPSSLPKWIKDEIDRIVLTKILKLHLVSQKWQQYQSVRRIFR